MEYLLDTSILCRYANAQDAHHAVAGNAIVELHRRMAAAGSAASLTAGLKPRPYTAAIVLLAFVAVAMAGLFIRAVLVGEWAGVLFLAGFAALFSWQIGGFVRRNRPRAYSFDHLPEALLP